MKEPKFFIELSSGSVYEIGKIDFNNLKARVAQGKTNGWYSQRGEHIKGSRKEWQIAFKDVASIYREGDEYEDKVIRKPEAIDVEKRTPKLVGKVEEKKDTKCPHDWNNPDHWNHVTTIVGGVNRYYKQCASCGGKSPLVKKREVELAQEARGETIDTVPFVE
jgi:hypothetical protein